MKNVTRVIIFFNVSRVQSESLKIVTLVELLTRVTPSLVERPWIMYSQSADRIDCCCSSANILAWTHPVHYQQVESTTTLIFIQGYAVSMKSYRIMYKYRFFGGGADPAIKFSYWTPKFLSSVLISRSCFVVRQKPGVGDFLKKLIANHTHYSPLSLQWYQQFSLELKSPVRYEHSHLWVDLLRTSLLGTSLLWMWSVIYRSVLNGSGLNVVCCVAGTF